MMNLSFFKRPSFEIKANNSFKQKTKELFVAIFWMYGMLFIAGIFLKLIDFFIHHESNFSFFDTIFNQQKIMLKGLPIYFVVILGPLMEELIFRLPLNLKRINILISLSFLSFYLVGDKIVNLSLSSFYTWIKVLPVVLIVFFGKSLIKEKKLELIEKSYFTIYFYSLSIFFGLMHLMNFYKVVPHNLLILAPLFVIPQIVAGSFAGYLRLKNGFLWGFLLHSLFNTVSILLSHF